MFEKNQTELRKDICEVGRRVWQRGYVAFNDGNISIRLDQKLVLATPTGVSKGFLSPDMLVLVDMEGNQVGGHLKMSSEILMHLAMYRERCDIGAVVHAHPPYATGFAVAGEPLNRPTLPEFVVALGGVPLAPYAAPSTPELGESVKPYIKDHDVFLLANHGALSIGGDVYNAYHKMETLEHGAFISFIARMLGQENEISAEELPHLHGMRQSMGLTYPRECLTFPPGSRSPVNRGGGEVSEATLEAVVRQVAERLLKEMGRQS
jgi:L-fuculose-phosphate aldolase